MSNFETNFTSTASCRSSPTPDSLYQVFVLCAPDTDINITMFMLRPAENEPLPPRSKPRSIKTLHEGMHSEAVLPLNIRPP